MMADLEGLRDALADIPGVASCKVGLEGNISPADYPLIRIVPTRLTPGRPYTGRVCEVMIYFGARLSESEGLESVYDALFDLEAAILEVLRSEGGIYRETLTDEDRLEPYKIMSVRAEIQGVHPAPPAPAPAPAPAPPPG
jgi:hypothetical protein